MSKIVSNFQKNYRRKKYQWQFVGGALLTAALLFITLIYTTPFPPYLSWLLAISLVTFAYFGWDKRKAQTGSDIRIPEIVLHLLNLFGGFLGGFLGMQLFRHKTDLSKNYIFPAIILLALIIHIAIFWYTPF